MQTYGQWKLQPLTVDQTKEQIGLEIASLISDLTKFYGLTGLQPDEMESILNFIFHYLKKWQRFKTCDMFRAVELYKKRPELNKLCAEYFETIFNLYLSSQERKEILTTYDLEISNRVPEKCEQTPEQRLAECKARFKLYGKIEYNNGKVYTENYQEILKDLGADTLEILKQQAKENIISECQSNILSKNKSDAAEAKSILELFESNEYFPLWKVETRKLHLAEWFKNMEMVSL